VNDQMLNQEVYVQTTDVNCCLMVVNLV